MASKRKASAMASAVPEEPVDPADELMFLCLGGGNEVGRSCHVVQYKGKTVMVCRENSYPVLDSLLTVAGRTCSSTPANTQHTMVLLGCHSSTTLI
jgi:hypothetical protein